jgi:nucleoside-diphosphate-sugar epimerase
MKKILLIGGNGYVGSYFKLKNNLKYVIQTIDINWFNLESNNIDFKTLNKKYIQQFDSVILLAGHSSVKMCDDDMLSSFNNNVVNFINLLDKLSDNQQFIYASSSSVYGNTNYNIVDENYMYFEPNNYYDLSKHAIDLYALKSGKNFYGLRFGTVNGWSPMLRTDVMINSMVNSSFTSGHIKLYIKDIMRAILGIDDLSNALQAIIDSDKQNPGIYNLASFNKTSEEIANKVSEVINIPIVEYDAVSLEKITNVKLQTNAYNFAINSDKFINLYNFKFNETIESITKSIIDGYDNCIKTNRNEKMSYGRL